MENMVMDAMINTVWKNKHVFITGCTGLLGSWLTKALIERGAIVTGLIRDTVPESNLNRSGFQERINIVHGRLENYLMLERALNEYEIETVFHLGAQTIVGIANRNPLSTFDTNIRGSWNLFEACRRISTVKQVIVASSDKAYGIHKDLPYNETYALKGSHPYDVSKSCVDLIASAYYVTYKLPVCITRCGNFYGGGDLNFNRITPEVIRAVLHGQKPVIRSDGASVRDYIYIKDAVQAYLLLAEKMEDGFVLGEAFNFSNESQITTLALTQMILRLMNREDLQPEILGNAQSEIPHQYLSAQKARDALGWNPVYSLEDGLKETIAWYEDFFKGQK